MAPYIYALCALTSLVCSVLLLRGYSDSRYRLLFWAGLCFVGLRQDLFCSGPHVDFAADRFADRRQLVVVWPHF